jgi:uncharacterized protein YcbK (DUF882 family)
VIRALAAVAVVSLAVPAPAAPGAAPLPKKDRELRARTTSHPAPPAPGTRPAPLVNLYNQWTHEWLAVDADTPAVPATEVSDFLRDHYTNKERAMDPRLVGMVVAAARNFHSDVVDVVSGFRHPKYNLMLRKKGHQVARDSQHTQGHAIDFYLPQVPIPTLDAWAKAQHWGGVGIYLQSHFVHMDTAHIRYWSGD